MNIKRGLLFLMFLLFIPSAFAWELTLGLGESKTEYFNISLNDSCTVYREGVGYWVIAPEVINGSVTINDLPLTIKVPLNETPRVFAGEIKYCDYEIPITLTITSPTITPAGCPVYLSIYGKPIAGKTIKFDIRDKDYYRTKNPDTIISVESTETGEFYSVECSQGACSWQIPEDEEGLLILEVVTPGCNNTVIKELELKMMGTLVISAPEKVYLGDDFYIFIYDPASGPIKYATVQIMGPTGEVFNGKTNENGILYDEALIKRYGIDIKPKSLGKHQIYANLVGYDPASSEFEVLQEECPYECCVGQVYINKPCESGYECIDNECKPIVKPKLKVKCSPENPIVYDEITCSLLGPNNNAIADSVQGTLKFEDKEETLIFANGSAEFSFSSPGKFEVKVPDVLGYSGDSYVGAISGPPIPWFWIYSIGLIILVIIIIFAVLRLRRRKVTKGPEIVLESTPATVEKVTTER